MSASKQTDTASKPGDRVYFEDNVQGKVVGTVVSSTKGLTLVAVDSPSHAKPVVQVEDDLLTIV